MAFSSPLRQQMSFCEKCKILKNINQNQYLLFHNLEGDDDGCMVSEESSFPQVMGGASGAVGELPDPS